MFFWSDFLEGADAIMATISTRVDEGIKRDAEIIAEEIGIPLSTAINVFIKKFISERGFPFNVNVKKDNSELLPDEKTLDLKIKNAISDPTNSGLAKKFSYFDPQTQKRVTVTREE